MRVVIGRAALLMSLLFAILAPQALVAQERSALRQDFTMPSDGTARILLLRPSVKVGAQSTGGMFEPNADWTEQARQNINSAIDAAQDRLGNRVVELVDPVGPQAQALADYSALFNVIASSVIQYQFFVGNRLETKKRDNREGQFDWTMGPGVRDLPGADQADYALFITTEDHYGSTGRKVLQLFAAMGGVGVTSGVHIGYAALIDLRTGNIVWINADGQMGGDVRTPEGAARRVSQLLEDFPGSTPATTGAAR